MQKYSVLIPAAGFSGRMQEPKAFLPWPGAQSLAHAIIQAYLSESCEKIVLVLNSRDFSNTKLSTFIPAHPKLQIVLNPIAEKGRFTSIQAGANHLPEQVPVFLHNVDNPPPHANLISEMLENLENHAFLIPRYQQTNGHPLLMNTEILQKVKKADENSNLRDILSAHEGKIMPCNIPNILVNLNTPEEYERFLNL